MPDENAIQTVLQRVYFASSSPVLNAVDASVPVLTIKVQIVFLFTHHYGAQLKIEGIHFLGLHQFRA
jgi:hypothetical protein